MANSSKLYLFNVCFVVLSYSQQIYQCPLSSLSQNDKQLIHMLCLFPLAVPLRCCIHTERKKKHTQIRFCLIFGPALSTVAKIHFRMFCKMSNVQSCWQELCVVEAEMNAVLHIMSLRGIIPAMRTEQIWHEAEIHNIGIKTIFIDEWLACDRMGHVRFHSPASMCKHAQIHIHI